MSNNKIKVARRYICSFENTGNGNFKLDTEKYSERLCVIDGNKGIAIDVETKHQYPEVRTTSTLHIINEMYRKKILEGQRVACFGYDILLLNLELSSDEINKCNEIINLLKKGATFKDGNQELSNEEYINMIKQPKKEEKTKKIRKKGK